MTAVSAPTADPGAAGPDVSWALKSPDPRGHEPVRKPALACRVLLKIVYLLTCRVLSVAVLVLRSDLAKMLSCWYSGMRTRYRGTSAGCGIR